MPVRHFLTGTELSASELAALLARAQELADAPLSSRALDGRSVALIFQKPSTRTRISFEVGIDELGGHPVVLRSEEMQLSRGEALRDTALVLSRHVAAVGVRTGPDETLEELARWSSVPVVNMLTAKHHPCQALADLLTIRQARGEVAGARLAYVGDGNNVARSLAILGSLAGVHVAIASPDGYALEADLAPPPGASGSISLHTDPREAVAGADAVYTDVWVSMGDEATADARRRRPRRLQGRRRAARRGRAGSVRDARPARSPRRGDHRRGALRRAPAHLGPGGEPPPRPEGAARAAGLAVSAPPTQARPQRGDELELEIESLAFGGEGVARLGDGGYVVFVAGAIPGDRVRAVVHKRKRSYAHARTLEVLTPSPERIAPRAAHPGVPWQVLPYERQLEIKHAQVREALERIGHLEGFALEEIVPAQEQWRYRNKLEYSFGNGPDGSLVCGFHAPAGGNAVVPIDDCLLASELGNRAREAGAAWCIAQRLTAWERGGGGVARMREERVGPADDGRVRLRNLVVREGRRTGKVQVRLVSSDGELDAAGFADALEAELGDSLSGVLWTRSDRPAETTQGGRTELVAGRGGAAGADRRARPPHLARGLLPDEHRDGRGALRRRRRVRGARGLGARLRPLLRDRLDRADARAARGRAVGDRADRAGRRRRDRGRAGATRSRRRISSPATRGWRSRSCWSARVGPT